MVITSTSAVEMSIQVVSPLFTLGSGAVIVAAAAGAACAAVAAGAVAAAGASAAAADGLASCAKPRSGLARLSVNAANSAAAASRSAAHGVPFLDLVIRLSRFACGPNSRPLSPGNPFD